MCKARRLESWGGEVVSIFQLLQQLRENSGQVGNADIKYDELWQKALAEFEKMEKQKSAVKECPFKWVWSARFREGEHRERQGQCSRERCALWRVRYGECAVYAIGRKVT
jgi:hypothetical protein